MKVNPAVRYSNITSDPTKLLSFFRASLNYQAPAYRQNAPSITAHHLYQHLFPILEGTYMPEALPNPFFVCAQQSGMCAEIVLHAYLAYEWFAFGGDPPLYKKFKEKYKMRALIEYFHAKKASNQLAAPITQWLLRKSLINHSRLLRKQCTHNLRSHLKLKKRFSAILAIEKSLSPSQLPLNFEKLSSAKEALKVRLYPPLPGTRPYNGCASSEAYRCSKLSECF